MFCKNDYRRSPLYCVSVLSEKSEHQTNSFIVSLGFTTDTERKNMTSILQDRFTYKTNTFFHDNITVNEHLGEPAYQSLRSHEMVNESSLADNTLKSHKVPSTITRAQCNTW